MRPDEVGLVEGVRRVYALGDAIALGLNRGQQDAVAHGYRHRRCAGDAGEVLLGQDAERGGNRALFGLGGGRQVQTDG